MFCPCPGMQSAAAGCVLQKFEDIFNWTPGITLKSLWTAWNQKFIWDIFKSGVAFSAHRGEWEAGSCSGGLIWCARLRVCVWVHVCEDVFVCPCKHVCLYVFMYACVCLCLWTCVYSCTTNCCLLICIELRCISSCKFCNEPGFPKPCNANTTSLVRLDCVGHYVSYVRSLTHTPPDSLRASWTNLEACLVVQHSKFTRLLLIVNISVLTSAVTSFDLKVLFSSEVCKHKNCKKPSVLIIDMKKIR